ncbi:hypothetical protein Tco_0682368 [Tanacetum coccineum]|uniref:Uncharacterized protein n=1 Tax=Tanacetum coccineum TaxID=301880 RepID=A0ABQ4XSV2_9ASTR
MGDDEPITKKVQETSNDDKTKADFSEPESMPDDEFMDFTEDTGIAESEEETGNIHASAKEIWKRQYKKPTSSVPVNKEVVITITSLSAEVIDLGDIIGTSVPMAVGNSVNSLLPKLINDLLVPDLLYTKLKEAIEYVNDKFEELNKVEIQRFAILEKALKSTIKGSVKSQLDKVVDLFKCSFGHHLQLLGYLEKILKSSIQIKTAPTPAKTTNEVPTESNAPTQGEPEETGLAKNLTMVVHKDADLKESDPPTKKTKIAENLFKTKESKFSPSPPRHDIQDKGKGIVEPNKDDQIKMIMPLVDEGGSNPDLLELKKFRGTRERPMTIEEAKQQMEEPKRLSDIKKYKEESKKALKKMSLAKRQAQRHKLKEIEAKREKLRAEYFNCINERTSPKKITKYKCF